MSGIEEKRGRSVRERIVAALRRRHHHAQVDSFEEALLHVLKVQKVVPTAKHVGIDVRRLVAKFSAAVEVVLVAVLVEVVGAK